MGLDYADSASRGWGGRVVSTGTRSRDSAGLSARLESCSLERWRKAAMALGEVRGGRVG